MKVICIRSAQFNFGASGGREGEREGKEGEREGREGERDWELC